jgi:hypothetical protein
MKSFNHTFENKLAIVQHSILIQQESFISMGKLLEFGEGNIQHGLAT